MHHTGGPPNQRGSTRNVTIEDDHITYMCEVRTLPGSGLRVGDYCWVEFGACWSEIGGVKTRHPGQWRQCEVLRGPAGTSADVHVRLSPALRAEQPPPMRCHCDQGWVCEDHLDLPLEHGCGGVGRKCDNPECPWWKGPRPAASDLQAELKRPS